MSAIKMRVRFDYVAESKSGRLFFNNKNNSEQAEEIRQHKVALLRNIPVQGIYIEDIDMSQEIYSIYDEVTGKVAYYAPVNILFTADSLEDAVKFAMKEEFRTVEVLEPQEIALNPMDTVRLLIKINEELMSFKHLIERRIEGWK